MTTIRWLKEQAEQLIHISSEEKWGGNHFVEAAQKMKNMEKYIDQGITAEIFFSPEFAEATKKYFFRIRQDDAHFLKKLNVLESILKW